MEQRAWREWGVCVTLQLCVNIYLCVFEYVMYIQTYTCVYMHSERPCEAIHTQTERDIGRPQQRWDDAMLIASAHTYWNLKVVVTWQAGIIIRTYSHRKEE